MQVDFATIRRDRDRLTVFIGTLGWSRATYVEFVTDERMETLLGCHERAFYYFGDPGVRAHPRSPFVLERAFAACWNASKAEPVQGALGSIPLRVH
jgi:hypothetical protein